MNIKYRFSVCGGWAGFASSLIWLSAAVAHAAPQEDAAGAASAGAPAASPSKGQDDEVSTEQTEPSTETTTEPLAAGATGADLAPEPDDKAEPDTKEKGGAAAFLGSLGVRQLSGDAYPGDVLSRGALEAPGSCFRGWEQARECAMIRGIPGGSLWFTFHGMQWPYMPQSGIGISGDAWVDTGYEKVNIGAANQPNIRYFLTQGRFVLRVTPTWARGDWFIQGQAEVVANADQTETQPRVVDTDDLWVRVGQWGKKSHNWDIQAGRYQAWELYHLGMGLDLNTLERSGAYDSSGSPPDIYLVSWAFYRPSGVGNVAFHYYPIDVLRFEALLQYGNQSGLNTVAGRGAGILDFGWLKIKAGGEYKKQNRIQEGVQEETDQRGFGGTVQFVIGPWVETGMSGSWAIVDKVDISGNVNRPGSITKYSWGPFLNVSPIRDLVIGGGAHYTKQWDIHKNAAMSDRVGNFSHFQSFGAIQYRLFGQLFIKQVVAYAKANFAPSFDQHYSNDMFSLRLRLEYLF